MPNLYGSDSQVAPDTGKTRPSTATSDSAISLSDGADTAGQGGKKRKRDVSTSEDLLRDSFVVRVRVNQFQEKHGF